MTITDLPGELTTTTRDAERDRILRDYSFWAPTDNISPGGIPYAWASTTADAMMPLYHDIRTVADAQDPSKIGGALLKTRAEADGVFRFPAAGASGSVKIGASAGGTTISAGTEGTIGSVRYRCSATAHYDDGDDAPVAAVDTGTPTNQAPGAILVWSSPPPGCTSRATVVTQSDGSGLSGGRPEESDDEYRARWNLEKARRAAAGNDAHIQELAEDSKSTGVAIEKAFTYPAILGPGTTCLALTLKPSAVGDSRIPNSTQRAAVLAYVTSKLDGSDGVFDATVIAQPFNVVFRVSWSQGATGWADLYPWPIYYANPGQALIINTATDSTHFTIKAQNGSYSGITAPSAGKTISVYDTANAMFRAKKILSVVGTGPWTIVCDTTNSASDTTYTPVANQRVMPWSDSLQKLVEPIQAYFGTLGPGEQVASFFDDGIRQRRQPESPRDWPSVVTTKGLESALNGVAELFDVEVASPTLPWTTSVGTPAVTSYLQTIGSIAVLPL